MQLLLPGIVQSLLKYVSPTGRVTVRS